MDCSRDARLLFIGLWNFCDDTGRHPASVRQLKAEVFPGDDVAIDQVGAWVNELIEAELLIEYEVDGKHYWQVTGWHHQYISKRQPARYPAPPEGPSTSKTATPSAPKDTPEIPPFPEQSRNVPGTVPEQSGNVPAGYDTIGREGKGSTLTHGVVAPTRLQFTGMILNRSFTGEPMSPVA